SPAYNIRSKRAMRLPWLRFTDEPLPRLSITRTVPSSVPALGPFSRHADARAAQELLQEAGVRACNQRLPIKVRAEARACALADMGRCLAPCVNQDATETYAHLVARVERAMTGDIREVFNAQLDRIRNLANDQRFEDAARARDRLMALLYGAQKSE